MPTLASLAVASLLAGAALSTPSLTAPLQILESRPFEEFAQETSRICASRGLRFITPGDLSWYEEQFRAQLPKAERTRVERADGGQKLCRRRHGLSCPTTATLAAFSRTRLIQSFATFSCSHDLPGLQPRR
jgi:hypothetical protein